MRFSPALANKPKGPPPDPSKPHKPIDPFKHPPPALRLADVGPSHFLVLNKFAVVPEHFILATTEFKHQTHVLEPSDLEATLACIDTYEQARKGGQADRHTQDGLFAFFNSGEHSGASQPHRHIQLLPVSRMRDGLSEEEDGGSGERGWNVLASRLDEQQPPFTVFWEPIRLGMSGGELHEAYLRLYRRACDAVAKYARKDEKLTDGETEPPPSEGEAVISYNMAMTSTTLALMPRLAEGTKIVDSEGRVLGSLALNGTVLAGTALVKSELEWEALRKNESGFAAMLGGIGVPGHSTG